LGSWNASRGRGIHERGAGTLRARSLGGLSFAFLTPRGPEDTVSYAGTDEAGGQRVRARNTHASRDCWVSNIARASASVRSVRPTEHWDFPISTPPRRGCQNQALTPDLHTAASTRSSSWQSQASVRPRLRRPRRHQLQRRSRQLRLRRLPRQRRLRERHRTTGRNIMPAPVRRPVLLSAPHRQGRVRRSTRYLDLSLRRFNRRRRSRSLVGPRLDASMI
jgi:hypothetical protein